MSLSASQVFLRFACLKIGPFLKSGGAQRCIYFIRRSKIEIPFG
jgi:hypothetical protein